MSVTKVGACSTLNAIHSEQKSVIQEEEGHDNLDSLIQNSIGKEPFLSFSRAGDNPVQLMQLLHAFDQHGSGKVYRSLKGGNCEESKENSLDLCSGVKSFSSEPNGIKEPFHSLKHCGSNANDSKSEPAQMQNLRIPDAVVAFAHAAAKANGEHEKLDLPGWPLLSPSKAQLQKCDKCSREFCSSINYRRHIRTHRRSLNGNKYSPKSRDLLGAFWDNLSIDDAKELVSLKNVIVEEVSGSSVTKALSTWIRRSGGLSFLPQLYSKAGLTLLDVVQASPSRFPISSHELFSVLDDASEKTFLCAGTALSLQKYVFNGETVKKALEIKNLVACTSFLLEMELVKAWIVDKDAEALKCQKLLVEEEEATQKRQAELLEKKRRKKLRQKEQKIKEMSNGEKIDFKISVDSADCSGSIEAFNPWVSPEDCTLEASLNQEHQSLDSVASSDAEGGVKLRLSHDGDAENMSYDVQTKNQNLDHDRKTDGKRPRSPFCHEDVEQEALYQTQRGTGHKQPNRVLCVYSKVTRNNPNGFRAGKISAARFSAAMRHNNYRDSNAVTQPGIKVWAIKSRPDNGEDGKHEGDMEDRELEDQPGASNGVEVLIGSINVTLGDGDCYHPYTILRPQIQEKPVKPDASLNSVSRTPTKLWRPVSRHGNGNSIQDDNSDAKADVPAINGAEHIPRIESSLDSVGTFVSDFQRGKEPMFSSEVAKAFLEQRWKEAIAGDHMVVASSLESEASEVADAIEDSFAKSPLQASDFHQQYILGCSENQLAGIGVIESATTGGRNLKFVPKMEKNARLKYVPKQKSIATEK